MTPLSLLAGRTVTGNGCTGRQMDLHSDYTCSALRSADRAIGETKRHKRLMIGIQLGAYRTRCDTHRINNYNYYMYC